MTEKRQVWSRRDFLKGTGLMGVGTLVSSVTGSGHASETGQTVPSRTFGRSGIKVPRLAFGGSLNSSLSPQVLRRAVKWGVTYWDTANSYMGGNSEKGMGRYLEKFPEDRSKLFLVTKSRAWTLNGMTRDLDQSLGRLKTEYINLFLVHGVGRLSELDEKTHAWAEKAKSEGKIRLFGFSTHSNMEECMLGAAELGWIDGIMMTYNFRLMHSDSMKRAVDACARAGIGLTAMKTQGGGQVRTGSRTELKLGGHFVKKGYTAAQAKLKAVWENPLISSICSEMPNMTILKSNVAAALNRRKLSSRDMKLLNQYARESGPDYCRGCTRLCESALNGRVPVGDVMRYLMYSRSYGDLERAATLFKKIPERVRERMTQQDYSSAEQGCPQNIAIGRLMAEAWRELS